MSRLLILKICLWDYGTFVLGREKEPGWIELNQVSELYVEKMIGEIKATNCLADPILSKIIKKVFKLSFTPVITTLINLRLKTDTLSKEWKISTVTPLFKKSQITVKNKKNYWMVNNLCILSRSMEQAMLEQLDRCIAIHNTLPDYQPTDKTSLQKQYWSKFILTS